MVNGKELANAYSELNDPIEQRERFEDQLKLTEKVMMKQCLLIRIFARVGIRNAANIGHWHWHRPIGDVYDQQQLYSGSFVFSSDETREKSG